MTYVEDAGKECPNCGSTMDAHYTFAKGTTYKVVTEWAQQGRGTLEQKATSIVHRCERCGLAEAL